MSSRAEIGRRGEDVVCQYLTEHGHTILERNWRTGHLEVDIISLDREGVHFVEVKSRVAPVMASPEENVRQEKQRRIAKAAGAYLRQKGSRLGDAEVWLDVAAVVFDGGTVNVEYFPAAYMPVFYR